MSKPRPKSNSARSADYILKLEALRHQNEHDAPFDRGKVVRAWIVRQLGCHPSFLSSSTWIKHYLRKWDQIRSGMVDLSNTPMPDLSIPNSRERDQSSDAELDEFTLVRIGREQARKLKDHIEWGDAKIGKTTRRCPLVTFNGEFQAAIYEWQCMRIRLDGPETLWDSAKIVVQFFRLLRRRKVLWSDVDDEHILDFRQRLRANRTGRERINKIISVIHSFYRFQETVGRLRYRVQIYTVDALPEEMRTYEFPIKSELRTHTSKRGVRTKRWSSPWLLKGKESSFGKKHTPTDAELRVVHQNLYKGKHGVRNSVMMAASEDSGGRRKEILAVKARDLPNAVQLDRLLATGDKWVISVTRKGQDEQAGETAPLKFSASVVMRMVAYAQGDRAEIVRSTGSRAEELFLTEKGEVLKRDSLSKLATKIFRQAGVKNASYHKLRSKFIKRRIRTKLDLARSHAEHIGPASNWIETILAGAAIEMHHKTPKALRPYIDDIFAEDTAHGGPQTLADIEGKVREAQRQLADIDARISRNAVILRIVEMIETSPNRDELFERLRSHAEDIVRAA